MEVSREDTRRVGRAESALRAGRGVGAEDASVPRSQLGGGPGVDFQKTHEPSGITVPFAMCGSRSSGLWGSHMTTDPPNRALSSGQAGGPFLSYQSDARGSAAHSALETLAQPPFKRKA